MKKQFLLLVAMVTLVMLPAKAWDKMYLIGTATEAGYDVNQAVEMTMLSETEFTWTGQLSAGELKFLTTNDWVSMYGPAHNEYSTTSEDGKTSYNQLARNATYDLQFFGNGETYDYEDYKFGVAADAAGWYTIHIRTDLNQVTTWPHVVYPVGTGCEVGWSTEGTKYFEETGFGSGAYQGTLELKKKEGDNDPEVKFLCQKEYAAHFGPANTGDGQRDLYGAGKYAVAFEATGSNDRKFWVLDQAAGTYNMTLNAAEGNLYIVPQQITVKAQVELAALEEMGNVNCHVWAAGTEAKDYTDLVPTEEGWFEVAVKDVYMPVYFLFYGNEWKVKTPDMTNDENGYYFDKCCTIYAEKREDGKLTCLHNDNCGVMEQKITLEFKVKDGTTLSFEDNQDLYLRQWQQVWSADNTEEPTDKTTWTPMTRGGDGVYIVEVPAVNTVKLVLQHLSDGWNPVTAEVQTLSSKKYWIRAAEADAAQPYVLVETETFNSTTTLEPSVTMVNDNVVYDVMGRALGTSVENLPQGLYIRNGKTFVVVK